MMKAISFGLALTLAAVHLPAAPLLAQDRPQSAPETETPSEDGRSLMERGAQMFLDGMRREMGPALEDLRDLVATMGPVMQEFLRDMGPAMAELLGRIDDLQVYEMPELLPNGDIIIRRKEDAGPLPPPEDGEIDI